MVVFKAVKLFFASLFSVVVVVSNMITVKLFQVPFLSGATLPAGLITYPITFLISDLVNELYGAKQARQLVFLGFAMSFVACCIVELAIALPPSDPTFSAIFGLNRIALISSLAAYFVAQLLDIALYKAIRYQTGESMLWLRSSVSTFVSQALDTAVVCSIFLTAGLGLSWKATVTMASHSFVYKVAFMILSMPLFYLFVNRLNPYAHASCSLSLKPAHTVD